MKLPIINLKAILESSSNNHWPSKFKSLEEPTLKFLVDANAYYEKIPSIFIGLRGKTLESHRNDLISSAKDINVARFHANKNEYQNDIMKQKMREWYSKQNANFKLEVFCPLV